jgi:hypothetical protein
MKKSFYNWCNENKRQDLLDRWDYKLNNTSPKEIGVACTDRMWLKCSLHAEHKSELFNLSSEINTGKYFQCKQCNSFAHYLLDTYGHNGIDLYWAKDNLINPWEISRGSHKSVKLKCQKCTYHKDYLVECEYFTSSRSNGTGCPYCRKTKVHPLDSFAQYHIINTNQYFLETYWDWEKNNETCINPWEFTSAIILIGLRMFNLI